MYLFQYKIIFVYTKTYLYYKKSIFLFIYLSICLFINVYLSICLPIYLLSTIYISIYLYLSIYLSIYLGYRWVERHAVGRQEADSAAGQRRQQAHGRGPGTVTGHRCFIHRGIHID